MSKLLKIDDKVFSQLEGLAKLHDMSLTNYANQILGRVCDEARYSLRSNDDVASPPQGITKIYFVGMLPLPGHERPNIIGAIKEIRAARPMGLKDAKDVMDGVIAGKPYCLENDRKLAEHLRAVGGVIETR